MKLMYEPLGKYIRYVDERNKGVITENLQGVNIDKFFMPSVGNVIGTDLSKYKLLRKGRFACNPMHVGRDERLPVALYTNDEPAIVSPAYFMFEIIDDGKLDSDYLMLCFRNSDFDHKCWFRTDASVRGGLSWNDLCSTTIPVPTFAEQRRIVRVNKVINDRIKVLYELNTNLTEQARTLYKSWFLDFNQFDGLTPSDWKPATLGQIASIKTDSWSPMKNPNDVVEHYSIPAYDDLHCPVYEKASEIKSNKYILSPDSVMISKLNPETKRIWRPICLSGHAVSSTEFIIFEPKEREQRDYIYSVIDSGPFLEYLCSHTTGTTNSRQRATPKSALDFDLYLPPDSVINSFCRLVTPMYDLIAKNTQEIQVLVNTRNALLSQLLSGELDVSGIEF